MGTCDVVDVRLPVGWKMQRNLRSQAGLRLSRVLADEGQVAISILKSSEPERAQRADSMVMNPIASATRNRTICRKEHVCRRHQPAKQMI